VVAGLGRDDQLVAVGLEILGHHAAKVLFGGTCWWAIVVGQIEVVDALVESVAQDLALGVEWTVVTEVPPKSQGKWGKAQTRIANAAVAIVLITVRGSSVWAVQFRDGREAFVFHEAPFCQRICWRRWRI